MTEIEIWHNPRCSKSRAALAAIRARGIEPRVRLYLQDPPDAETLRDLLGKLGKPAGALLRAREAEAKTRGLTPSSAEDEIIAAMVAAPILIERPVLIAGDRAVVGRPDEAVTAFLDSL